jgi:mono/diheme cytochrome c family protein
VDRFVSRSALPLLLAVGLGATALANPAARVTVVVTDVKAPALEKPAGTKSAARLEAEQVMQTRCALCHGKEGRADGPMSKTLNPRPRALSDPAWQASVKDAHLTAIILGGGAVAGKSPIMPANPDLEDKPEVVAELVRILRGLRMRGLVRAELVDEDGAVVARGEGAPDASGHSARLGVEAPAGKYTLRVWHDVNEDNKRDKGEPASERAAELTGKSMSLGLSLTAPPPAEPTPAAAP